MTRDVSAPITVDGDRLWRSLRELAEIGAYHDATTGLTGVNRLALTQADVQARHQVITWLEDLGLAVRVDRMGNIFARCAGSDPDAAPVLTGSHVDTVATGGAFDGALGVLGSLEALRSFRDLGITPRRPIDLVVFTEEEGARFGTDMLGSAVAAGRIGLREAHGLVDKEGVTLAEALERSGFGGTVDERLTPPHAYVELHISQGPELRAAGADIGVVTGVQGISWQEIIIEGKAAHAGATPMELRTDAGVVAADLVLRVRNMADGGMYGSLRGTTGNLAFEPGLTNVVPARAVLTVDLRHPDEDTLRRAEDDLEAYVRDSATRAGVTATCRRTARTRPVPFDPGMQETIGEAAARSGFKHTAMRSGAGHDAQEMAAICPTGMIFVPGDHDGISHSPREYSSPEDCANGVTVLANTLLRLAE